MSNFDKRTLLALTVIAITVAFMFCLAYCTSNRTNEGSIPSVSASVKRVDSLTANIKVEKSEETSVSLKDVAKVIKATKIQHPDIVLAQAIEESGHWSSNRFRYHNNMFGMKKAGSRPTLAESYDKYGYAIYTKWQHSIYDYALYQSAFARGLSREGYFNKLKSYAGNPNYIANLKQIIKSNQLDNLF